MPHERNKLFIALILSEYLSGKFSNTYKALSSKINGKEEELWPGTPVEEWGPCLSTGGGFFRFHLSTVGHFN